MRTFRAAAVFSNNMVLQRDKNITIFGWGCEGKEVKANLAGNKAETFVKNGKWQLVLPPMKAGTGCSMELLSGTEKICFDNIAIGEVWLAGGQSNMEFELQNCAGGKEILQKKESLNVRYYNTPKSAYMDEGFMQREEESCWQEFGEADGKTWSAVGYFYAEKIARETGVTVGIIGCNWGGTTASVWMSRESLSEDKDTNELLKEYDGFTAGKTEEDQRKEFQEYLDYYTVWNDKCSKLYQKKPDVEWDQVLRVCGENKYPGPLNCFNQIRPCGLHQCMLERIMPYTLRGFLYYQGEDDDKHPKLYYKLLTRLIRQWREEWEDDSLPFLIVQLPMHKYKADPDWKNWCYIREAQMRTYQTIKNTGIAVILDCGEFNEIHPKNKKPVGERLALQALYHVYKTCREQDAFGPCYKGFQYENDGIRVFFDYAEDGFQVKGSLSGFEIAGENKVFVPAKAYIEGSSIFLREKSVPSPKYARYCWTNYGPVSVFGHNGIPLAPFRTSQKDDE